jgi:hypothetical protein
MAAQQGARTISAKRPKSLRNLLRELRDPLFDHPS